MKQVQFYKYATWGLLGLNLSLIAFFFLTAPPHHGKKFGKLRANDILKMDEQQNESFLEFAQLHMNQMDELNIHQQNLLKPYFNRLIDTDKMIGPDSILNQVQLLERRKIESTYQHFQDVKAILNPEQYVNFEKFIDHALERILLKQKKPPLPIKK